MEESRDPRESLSDALNNETREIMNILYLNRENGDGCPEPYLAASENRGHLISGSVWLYLSVRVELIPVWVAFTAFTAFTAPFLPGVAIHTGHSGATH